MSQFPPPSGVPVQATTMRCRRCGYDLSGCALGGHCPECGLSVRESLQGQYAGMQSQGSSVLCLVMGILSLMMCALFGPFAIWLYQRTKREVMEGRTAPDAMGLAKAGMVCGWIGVGLLALQLGALVVAIGVTIILP